MRFSSVLLVYLFFCVVSGSIPATAMHNEEGSNATSSKHASANRPSALYLQWLSQDVKGSIPTEMFEKTIPEWQAANLNLKTVVICDQELAASSSPSVSAQTETLRFIGIDTLLTVTWQNCFKGQKVSPEALSARFHELPLYVRCDFSRLMLGVAHQTLCPEASPIIFYADRSYPAHDIQALQRKYANVLETTGVLMANGACVMKEEKPTEAPSKVVFCENGIENGAMMIKTSNGKCQHHLRAFICSTMKDFLSRECVESIDPQFVFGGLRLFLYNLVAGKSPGQETDLSRTIPVASLTGIRNMIVHHPRSLALFPKTSTEYVQAANIQLRSLINTYAKGNQDAFTKWLDKNTNNGEWVFPVMEEVCSTRPSRFTESAREE